MWNQKYYIKVGLNDENNGYKAHLCTIESGTFWHLLSETFHAKTYREIIQKLKEVYRLKKYTHKRYDNIENKEMRFLFKKVK